MMRSLLLPSVFLCLLLAPLEAAQQQHQASFASLRAARGTSPSTANALLDRSGRRQLRKMKMKVEETNNNDGNNWKQQMEKAKQEEEEKKKWENKNNQEEGVKKAEEPPKQEEKANNDGGGAGDSAPKEEEQQVAKPEQEETKAKEEVEAAKVEEVVETADAPEEVAREEVTQPQPDKQENQPEQEQAQAQAQQQPEESKEETPAENQAETETEAINTKSYEEGGQEKTATGETTPAEQAPQASAEEAPLAGTESSTSHLLEGAKNFTTKINTTAIALSACEQIELTMSFVTSLDFDKEFWNVMNFTRGTDASTSAGRHLSRGALLEVYLLQIILTPISILLAFFGSHLLHPTCCLAAAAMGVFLVFHLVDMVAKSKSALMQSLSEVLDCSMKLALSVISAFLCAFMASSFLRFGIFCAGAIAAGGCAYLVFDAFPFLDPTRPEISYDADITLHGQMDSELSPFGWVVTTLVGVFGGLFLRWYEQASLEIVTAAMGGLGCAYSMHTFVTLQGGELNRSLVFLLANFIAFSGWRFQRNRRVYRNEYAHKKNEEMTPLVVPTHSPPPPNPYVAYPPPPPPPPPPPAATGPPPATWNQLQSSINTLLSRNQQAAPAAQAQAGPSEAQIIELTKSLNSLITKMDESEKNDAMRRTNALVNTTSDDNSEVVGLVEQKGDMEKDD